MYAEIEEPVKAVMEFTKTIEFAPMVATVYYERGNMYLNQKIYDRAIEDYTKAIIIYPKFSDAICNRGIAFYSQKKYELAIDDFNVALQINPDDTDVEFYLQKIKDIINNRKQ